MSGGRVSVVNVPLSRDMGSGYDVFLLRRFSDLDRFFVSEPSKIFVRPQSPLTQ